MVIVAAFVVIFIIGTVVMSIIAAHGTKSGTSTSKSKSSTSQSTKGSTSPSSSNNANDLNTGSSITSITNPYNTWATCHDNGEGLFFLYPNNWLTGSGAEDSPCTGNDAAGAYFELTSPEITHVPYVIDIHYFGNQQPPGPLDQDQGQTILSVMPLHVANSQKQLSLVAIADNQLGSTKVFEYTLTDQNYKTGQVVDYVPNVSSQNGGQAYSMTASLIIPGQTYSGIFTLSQYRAQPDYQNMIKIFQSLTY